MIRMTATEAARRFSEALNRVTAGEEIEITRSGAAVAVLRPPRAQAISAERFREMLAAAPHPDDGFADDVRAAQATIQPPVSPWPS